MNYNRLGKSGILVSELCMGGSVPRVSEFSSGILDRDFLEIYRAAFGSGITFFDNAESYGGGRSETLLGKALGKERSRIQIASKVSYEHTAPENIRSSCENSLRRIGTDYLDIYFIHYPNDSVPLSEVIGTMTELKQEGKIRALGVCNFSRNQLEESVKHGQIDAVQQCYSLLWRKYMEAEIQPFCRENGIGIIPYSPLAVGLLSGKFTPDWSFDSEDQRGRPANNGILLFQKEWFASCVETVNAMKPIALRYGKTMVQLALNWAKSREGVCSVITGAKSAGQLSENIGAAGWSIDSEDMRMLDDLSREVTDSLPVYLHFFMKMVPTNSTV
ncbi:aldo/keto reductase [Breznakiella homolactica]|uniref:Aldo/keto reductase n=1 Tax=Breznakiella homolactica TaxID=2798577 RepID=A0A7T7XKJ2_9SPIR|nr:aldo/keto reductase [Breznakiella homolactica]QQO08099.1 aldo/keto reductase [Breznakiella homolactica]